MDYVTKDQGDDVAGAPGQQRRASGKCHDQDVMGLKKKDGMDKDGPLCGGNQSSKSESGWWWTLQGCGVVQERSYWGCVVHKFLSFVKAS